jgi:hypothetical protein
MKKSLFGIITFLTLSVLFNSCQIEKRLYQDGYHISWNRSLFSKKIAAVQKTNQTEIFEAEIEETQNPIPSLAEPNAHSVETLSSSSIENNELMIAPKKSHFIKSISDTIIPDQPKQQEEYFNNNYTNPLPTNELQDTKLANWALGLGIASISAPVWGVLLFLLIVGILGASWSSIGIWTAFGIAILGGGVLFIAMEILAITFAIRFLRLHAKDPNYRKYRSRAITGLILAGIYPALMLLNIIIGLAMI